MFCEFEQEIINKMRENDIRTPEVIIVDGQIHRFSTTNNPSKKNGWYIFFDEKKPCGAFGDWAKDITIKYRFSGFEQLTPEEKQKYKENQEFCLRKAETETAVMQGEVAKECKAIWESLPVATVEHPYIQKKHLSDVYGAKVNSVGHLVIPKMDMSGNIWSLQFITADSKSNYQNGKCKGMFWQVGQGSPAYLAEGYATACSIYEATQKPCLIAYTANNLANVASIFPDVTIVADNDESQTGEKAAKACSNKYILIPKLGMDANDYATAYGLGALNKLLTPPPQFKLYAGDSYFEDLESRDWLIKDVIPRGSSFGFIYGDSGSGKTFVALDMMLSISTGRDKYLDYNCHRGKVLYLIGEGAYGVKLRVKAWKQEHGIEHLSNDTWYNSASSELLDTEEGLNSIIESLKWNDYSPELIVIDTLNRFMEGDENDTQSATAFIRHCQTLQEHYNCCVLLIHHIGVNEEARKRVRGSSAFKGNSDFQYLVEKTADDDIIKFSSTKIKDGKELAPIFFRKREVFVEGTMDEDGLPLKSLVLDRTDKPIEQEKEPKPSKYLLDLKRYVKAKGTVENGEIYITREALKQAIWDEKVQYQDENFDKKSFNSGVRMVLKRLIDSVPENLVATKKSDDGTVIEYKVKFLKLEDTLEVRSAIQNG